MVVCECSLRGEKVTEKIFLVSRDLANVTALANMEILAFVVSANDQHQAKHLLIDWAKKYRREWQWIEQATCEELSDAIDGVVYSEPQILGIKYHRR